MAGKFELNKGKKGRFMFSLKARNGQVLLSSEQYSSKQAAQNGISSVIKNAIDDNRIERMQSKKGRPFFVVKGGNGRVIGSSETYSVPQAMENGIESVKKNAVNAQVVDQT